MCSLIMKFELVCLQVVFPLTSMNKGAMKWQGAHETTGSTVRNQVLLRIAQLPSY